MLRARQQQQSAAELSATQGRYAVLVRKAILQYTQSVELERSRALLDAENRRVGADLRLQLAGRREVEFVRRRTLHLKELVRVGQLPRDELELYVRLATRVHKKDTDALVEAICGLRATNDADLATSVSTPDLRRRRQTRMAARLLVLLESLYGEVSQAALSDPRIPTYSQRPSDRDQTDSRDRHPPAYGQQPLSALRPLDPTPTPASAPAQANGERDFSEEKARYLRRTGSLKAPSESRREASASPISPAESPDRYPGLNMNFQEREWPTVPGFGNSGGSSINTRLQPERRSERDWERERERLGLRPSPSPGPGVAVPVQPERWRDSSLSPPPRPAEVVVVGTPDETRSSSRTRRSSEWEPQSRDRLSPTADYERERSAAPAGLRRQEPSSYSSSLSLSSRVSPEPRSDDWSSGRKQRDLSRPPPYVEENRYGRRNDF